MKLAGKSVDAGLPRQNATTEETNVVEEEPALISGQRIGVRNVRYAA
jgi:hypothetical protein